MNVKPGDLAIVTGSSRFRGHIVEVVRAWGGEEIDGVPITGWNPELNLWVCRFQRPQFVRGIKFAHGPFHDSALRPVSGLDEPTDRYIQLQIEGIL